MIGESGLNEQEEDKGLKIKIANAQKQRTIKLVLKSSLDSADWQTTP